MARNDASYSGTVIIDKYLPGRCDWQIVDLALDVDGSGLRPFPIAQSEGQPEGSADKQLISGAAAM